MDDLEKAIRNIETRTGVRPGFFDELLNEDDWSFIIKAHALLESACAEILTERSDVPELIDIFSRLELSDKKTGKLAFLKAFDLTVERERRFIASLSELRNTLVHNAKNTKFDLLEHVAGLDKNQRKNFIDSFSYAYLVSDEYGKETVEQPQRVIDKPKESIWLSLKYVLGILSVQIDQIRLERELERLRAQIGEQHFPGSDSSKRDV